MKKKHAALLSLLLAAVLLCGCGSLLLGLLLGFFGLLLGELGKLLLLLLAIVGKCGANNSGIVQMGTVCVAPLANSAIVFLRINFY